MQISLRVPPKTGELLKSLAQKTGKTRTAIILEALTEKYDRRQDRAQLIRDLAGWMTQTESEALRKSVENFNTIDDEDWR